jgi:threonine dehydratase
VSLADRVREAERRIRPHARETPLLHSAALSERVGGRVFLKLESLQHTGSFKLRGALNKLLGLAPEERARGVVTASTGNHGAATAFAGRLTGIVPTVFVPHSAVPTKIDRIRRLGATVELFGTDSAETELHARAVAARSDRIFLSPYNDWDVVAGQGTIAVELERQCPEIGAVIVALGGGGLIGGIAGYLDQVRPSARVVACSPENSAVMAASIRAGRILDLPSRPTLSDGTAGGVEPGAITFDLCRELIDDVDLVTEAEIAAAMRLAFEEEGLVIEGAAGVAIASVLTRPERFAGQDVVVVICGGNVQLESWIRVVEG